MTRNPDQRQLAEIPGNKGEMDLKPWQSRLQSVLEAVLVATIVYLVEKLLIHMISINYHRKQFNAKIKASKRNIYLLGLLYDASRALFPAYCPEFAEEDYVINDSITLGTGKKNNDRGSVTPMRLIQNVGRVGDKLTSAFGNIASEITGKNVFNPHSAHSIIVEALEKKKSSEALAKRLWMSFVVEGKDALYMEDLVEVLGASRREEAEECFTAIDQNGNGDISLEEMTLTVVEIGRQRKSIASSMHDVDQAINVLDNLLQAIAVIIVAFVTIAFLSKSFTNTLATAGTALLSMSFVFAVTAQEVLGSCIFLFVKHPYDVGDRVDIDNIQLTVEHISLLFSVFRRVDNHKTVQIPNQLLNQKWVENITRSKAMRETVLLYIHFDTTLEDIQLLKEEMHMFVKEHSRDFQPDIDVEVTGLANMDKLELKVEIKHKVRHVRRS
jgi:small-conductance mechanosensitive channel